MARLDLAAVSGAAAVDRARSLIGVAFRPQGRSGRFGLDCVGLAAVAFNLPLARVRADYSLRGAHPGDVERELAKFFDRVSGTAQPGDLVLASTGRSQLHLLLPTGAGYIHADAGLRRVVEVPGPIPWPILSAWRSPQAGQGVGG